MSGEATSSDADAAGLDALLDSARRAGADAADVLFVERDSMSVQWRLGRIEQVEHAAARDLGLRVFAGRRSACVSASSLDPKRFVELAERAVAMARVVPEDPFAGLAEPVGNPGGGGLLDLFDDTGEPNTAALARRAQAAEEAAMAVPGVTNSDGALAGWTRTTFQFATSVGFDGRFARTSHSLSAGAVAGSGTDMQRDSDSHSATHLCDLEAAEVIGRRAGERAAARLHPRQAATSRTSVVFHPRVAASLLHHLVAAINGASVARGTSFLKDHLGKPVLARGVQVIDDPRRPRGLRSRPFDGEGVATATRALVDDGVLRTWLLDSRTARQLGLDGTGQAGRGTQGPPSPAATNLYMVPGVLSPAELMADIREGFFVTEMLGAAINGLTGDYSRGAAGFMIRDGVLAEPVAEVTVAGNLLSMFAGLIAADDLQLRGSIDSPTVRIDGLVLAGH